MPENYFSIGLASYPMLVELQEYLRTKLPDARFVPHGQLHITLVYVPDVGANDLSEIEVPPLPVFSVRGDGIRTLQTDDGYAVVLELSPNPQLTTLQATLFYEIQALGLVTSPYSWPGLWRPHVTLAYSDADVDWLPNPLDVFLPVQSYELTGEDYTQIGSWALRTVLPSGAAVSEMASVRDVLVVGEFSGSYPTVNLWPDVDIEALTDGDEDPQFVTLPIGLDDVVSGNGRFYSAEFVRKAIAGQAKSKRVTGIKGHLPDAERATRFDNPDIYWVGTAKVGDMTWGKGYVPAGETRKMIARLRAIKGKIATSIYGTGKAEWDTQRGVWAMDADAFNLESIDLAPADRAGVTALAVVPHITSEMNDGSTSEEPIMAEKTKVEVIREMTTDDIFAIPDDVRAAIVAEVKERKVVAELREVVGVDGDADVVQEVRNVFAELKTLRADVLAGKVAAEIDANVLAGAVVTDGVKAARAMVRELVMADKQLSVNTVAETVQAVVERDHVKAMLSGVVVKEMGPTFITKSGTGGQKQGNQYFEIPDEEPAKK